VEGEQLQLITYTNADEVELVLNGKSQGKQRNPVENPKLRNQIRWNAVVYQPGKLEALAWKNGKVVARHTIETTGKAVRLLAEPDKTANWRADGSDLMHVRVVAVDGKGRRVAVAEEEVTFNVEGPASIVGVVNGDINSGEITVGNKRRLFNGTCTVILRASRQPGTVTLTASAPAMKAVKTKLLTE
jgi:beta-galactosidase